MPEFTNAFSGLKEDRMLTHNELVRAIRFMIAAEYEAIQLYTQLAESTNNKLAQEVLLDITNEEKEHAGEFLRLLQVLAPDEQGAYDEGMGETNEKIEKWKGSCQDGQCAAGMMQEGVPDFPPLTQSKLCKSSTES